MKVGIEIDAWKLRIFWVHLNRAGYTFTQGPGVTSNTLMLYVETDDVTSLHKVIKLANQECAEVKNERA